MCWNALMMHEHLYSFWNNFFFFSTLVTHFLFLFRRVLPFRLWHILSKADSTTTHRRRRWRRLWLISVAGLHSHWIIEVRIAFRSLIIHNNLFLITFDVYKERLQSSSLLSINGLHYFTAKKNIFHEIKTLLCKFFVCEAFDDEAFKLT